MTVAIDTVRTDADAAAVTELVWEFFEYLKRDFPDRREMIEKYLVVQDVAGEMAEVLIRFTPPRGLCLLARLDGKAVGTLMLKRVSNTVCEMNRMWVRPEGRGKGIGRALIDRLCGEARVMGFECMKLEALDERIMAVPLYENSGFVTDPDRSDYAREDLRIIAMKKVL